MKLSDLLNHLASCAARYRTHASSAIALNAHMHEYEGEPLSQEAVDALLSNFLNFLGASWGVPYAIVASDFEEFAKSPVLPLEVNTDVDALEEEEEPEDSEPKIILP